MEYEQLLANVRAILGTDSAGCCGDESGEDPQEVERLRASLRMMSEIRAQKNSAGWQPRQFDRGPVVVQQTLTCTTVGDSIDSINNSTATACQRHARESIDAVDAATKRTDDDVDQAYKAGKFPKPMPGQVVSKDSLWYRWKVFSGDCYAYVGSVNTGGINSLNCEVIETNAKQWMTRLDGFRAELKQVIGAGGMTPVGPLPDQPPPTIPDLPSGSIPAMGAILALGAVLLLKR